HFCKKKIERTFNIIHLCVYLSLPIAISTADEMVTLLKRDTEYIPADRLWVNPDCGLKTRDWPEVRPSPRNMVSAAKTLRGA
ncbi:MAG: hypothetical protein J6Y19_11650, partial [Kiritimatiellae bacterium]|nr:hypothetical protein [Kiritimatiellia bacterium]